MLATDFVSVPAADFETEAEPYLALVPERQTIGIYGVASVSFAGVGIRYSPLKVLMLDMSGHFTTDSFQTTLDVGYMVTNVKNPFNASANYAKALLKQFRIIAGLGISFLDVQTYGLSGSYGYLRSRFFLPFIKGGFEGRPQKRLGIDLFGNFLITEQTVSAVPQTSIKVGADVGLSANIVFYF